MLAMEKGRNGERYVLGGENINYNEFFSKLSDLTGKRQFMMHVPVPLIMLISRILVIFSHITGIPPLITPSLAKKYSCNWKISSNKAGYQLGYSPSAIDEGLAKTIDWLKNTNTGDIKQGIYIGNETAKSN
jgi:nucleoside-diphosphate-sugar epimerase